MFDLGIINGTVIGEDHIRKGNIYIRNGTIAALTGEGIYLPDTRETVDARGKLIFPGAVDCHMHIGEYQADFEDMRSSTMAAAAGGVTTCIDMPLNLYSPSVLNARAVQHKIELLSRESCTDFCVWGGLTPRSIDRLEEMREAGAISFKCFLTGGGNDFTAPTMNQIRRALGIIRGFKGLAAFHCEEFSIIAEEKERLRTGPAVPPGEGRQAFLDSRPVIAELIAVRDIIELARETGARVHICHVSHPDAAAAIETAQVQGVDITAETCPHFLTFTEEDYLKQGCLFGCAPPLRNAEAREQLWSYAAKGVLSCIASDHSPGPAENRSDADKPAYLSGYGISGVQTMFQTLYDQGVNRRGFPPTLLARALAAAPAKRWGIYGTKGALQPGFDADLVVFDPQKEWTVDAEALHYKQKITAYNGLSGRGMPAAVYIRGIRVAEYGRYTGTGGGGKFIRSKES